MSTAMLKEKLELVRQQLLIDKKKTAVLGVLFLVFAVVLVKTFVKPSDPDAAAAQQAADLVVTPQPVTPVAQPAAASVANAPSMSAASPGRSDSPPAAHSQSSPAVNCSAGSEEPDVKVVSIAGMPTTLERDLFSATQWGRFAAASPGRAGAGGASAGPGNAASSSFWASLAAGISDYHTVRQREVADIQTELVELRLQSTLTGPVPLAYISGRLVRVGDDIRGFTVERIADRHVQVRKHGQIHTLTMP